MSCAELKRTYMCDVLLLDSKCEAVAVHLDELSGGLCRVWRRPQLQQLSMACEYARDLSGEPVLMEKT